MNNLIIYLILWAAAGLALVSFVGLVVILVISLVHDLLALFRPVSRGPGRADSDSGPAGMPAPRKPVPPSLNAQAVAEPPSTADP